MVKTLFIALIVLFIQLSAHSEEVMIDELKVKSIELVHFFPTDYGFTDNPLITEDLQRQSFG